MRYVLVLILGAAMGCGSVAAHPDGGTGGSGGAGGNNSDGSTSDTAGQGGAGGTSGGNQCVVGISQVGSCTL